MTDGGSCSFSSSEPPFGVWMMGFVSGNKQLDHASPHSDHTSSGCTFMYAAIPLNRRFHLASATQNAGCPAELALKSASSIHTLQLVGGWER